MYVQKQIEKLLQHKDIKRYSHSELRAACVDALNTLKAENVSTEKPSTPVPNGTATDPSSQSVSGSESPGSTRSSVSAWVLPEPNPSCVHVEKFFLPFELACQSKTPKIVCSALDSIEKLIAYGHISHEYFDNQQKEFLAVAAATSENPKDAQTTKEPMLFDDHLTATVANCFSGPQTDEGIQVQVLKALLMIVTSGHIRVHENTLLLAVRTCYNIYLASRNLTYQATAKATLSQMINCVFDRMENACKLFAEEQGKEIDVPVVCTEENEVNLPIPEQYTNGHEGEEELVNGVADLYDAFDIVQPVVLDIVDKAFNESSIATNSNANNNNSGYSSMTTEQYANILQKDCFLVFRSLCKLSMKPLPEGYPDPKSHELRSKILSLHLLLGILQNGKEAFCNNDIFVSAIKSYLWVALSQNGVSSITEVFELSLALFIELLTKYKRHLKPQIEIFFKEICLNILEATTSSFEQKWLVIEGIGKICMDAQMVVDIYVNYDCDLSAANIFERIVDLLSKIAQGRQAFELGASPNQHKGIRLKGLYCLVSVLKCMVEWSKDIYQNPHAPKINTEQMAALNITAKDPGDLVGDSSDVEDSMLEISVSMDFNMDDPTQFEKVKQHKHILEHGIRLFSQKPKKGIKYLQDKLLIEDNMDSVANFLLSENNRLDKNAIGEYLGELENKEIMYHYVDAMDYNEMNFVSALRHFLEGFRLPGEAQKIDRLMEKFASRFCECNPNQDIFASADTAYVLAYSIIMLATDLHSDRVKKKMTKEEFIKNNRGINDSEDLPKEYLAKIYDEIASSEIKLKSSSTTVEKTVVTDYKKRQKVWEQESANISKTAEELMEHAASNPDGRSDLFVSATHLDHVKPMFRLAWSPVLAAFSVGLQDCDDADIAQLCLEGMQCAIRIACIFNFSMERNAFIQALARFTLLTYNSNVSEIKSKNIDTIKTLISVAYTDGNYLEDSWVDIMKCISQLEVAQTFSTTNQSGNRSSMQSSTMSSIAFAPLTPLANIGDGVRMGMGDSSSEQPFKESINAMTGAQSILVAVDRIFTGSRNLSGDAIVHFARALCTVSKDEIQNATTPRMFCLNKLVEISYYNMERIRLEWSRIWQVLGNHFNIVGCNDSQQISFFAVDSLKQLSFKFLEKGELQNFHFQKDFLRPFEFIMKNNKSSQIRDMVVRCISQMVQSQASNIKSGWKNIFATFALAASDNDSSIVELSFQSTTQVVNDFLANEKFNIVDSFQDCIKCLSEFGCNPLFPEISMNAINLIRKCAKYVSNHKNQFIEGGTENDKNRKIETEPTCSELDRVWIRGWFPVLFELSCIINSGKLDIRTRSLTVLFDIVKNYGEMFESNWWLDLFRVLFRIFDIVKNDVRDVQEKLRKRKQWQEWMDTTCSHALYSMTDVFNEFFLKLTPILLHDLLDRLQWCLQQENDQLSKSAIVCYENLFISNYQIMDLPTTHKILQCLLKILTFTIIPTPKICNHTGITHPNEEHIHISPTLGKDATAYMEIRNLECKMLQHLGLIKTVRRIMASIFISADGNLQCQVSQKDQCNSRLTGVVFSEIMALVECLLKSHKTASNMLSDKVKAYIVLQYSRKTFIPIVVKQETESLKCAVEILLELYHEKSTIGEDHEKTEGKLLSVLADVLSYFLGITSKNQQESWTSLLCLIFDQLLGLPDEKFKTTIPVVYVHICDILSVQITPTLREALCKIMKRIGSVYNIVNEQK